MVTFSEVPTNYRIPGTFFEISPRNPRPTGSLNRILLVGGFHDTASTVSNVSKGTATDKQPVLVTSAAEADALFGAKSTLANQFRVARANAPFSQIWVYPIEVGNSAVASTISIDIGTTAPEGGGNFVGTVVVQINGVNYNIPINSPSTGGTPETAIATAIANFINAIPNLPVIAAGSTRDFSLTSRTGGTIGNQFSVAVNDDNLANVTFTVPATGFTGGSGSLFTSGWDDGIDDEGFDTIVMPSFYDDVASTAVTGITAMSNRVDGRWLATGAEAGLFGHIWSSVKGTSTAIVTLLTPRNKPHESVVALEDANPTPEYIAVAAYASAAHHSLSRHPARPFTGLEINTVYPPARNVNRFNKTARNALLLAGASTIAYNNEQSVIERAVTTDVDQNTWRQAQIPYTLMVVLRRYRSWIETNYQRSLLVDDLPKDTNDGAFALESGIRVVTPKSVKGDFIGLYRDLALELLVEDVDTFAANLVVERGTQDQTRLESNLPLNLANGLIQFPILVDFTA